MLTTLVVEIAHEPMPISKIYGQVKTALATKGLDAKNILRPVVKGYLCGGYLCNPSDATCLACSSPNKQGKKKVRCYFD